MFREMRRFKQALSKEDCIKVLERCTNGILAVIGDDGYPYAVPLSYAYKDSKIVFHSAKTGHKLDAISKDNKVSFCVVDEDTIVPKEYTTYFRSVIVFGRARVLNEEESRKALHQLVDKYSAEYKATSEEEINKSFNAVCCVEIEIEHMSGKEAKEYALQK